MMLTKKKVRRFFKLPSFERKNSTASSSTDDDIDINDSPAASAAPAATEIAAVDPFATAARRKIRVFRRALSHGDDAAAAASVRSSIAAAAQPPPPSESIADLRSSVAHLLPPPPPASPSQRFSVTSVHIDNNIRDNERSHSSLFSSSTGGGGEGPRRRSVRFSGVFEEPPQVSSSSTTIRDNNSIPEDPFPNHQGPSPPPSSSSKRRIERNLSLCSSKYDTEGKGYLTKFQQTARELDTTNSGVIDPSIVVQLLEEKDALKKRQWVLLLGNIIQWLPVIVGAVYTFIKFSERQYQQNVGGRILTSQDYIRDGILSSSEIESLWELSNGESYPLSEQHKLDYLRDGFVVLPNFLTWDESQVLDKVVSHNLDEMAFPDLLTKCSRKFHGEHYHSTVTHRFWQQSRISDTLSTLALQNEVPYMVTSEILEMPSEHACIPQWHWDFLTFPQNYNASFTTGTQIWWSSEEVDNNVGGGLAFIPGSHRWANEVDDNAKLHPCFAMNLFDKMSRDCTQLLDKEMVIPKLTPRDIVVFSRFTLHRSVARNPSVPFKSPTGRRGYTLRVGSARSIFKQDTMHCFPSHPSSNFERQLKEGQRYDSVIDTKTGLPSSSAIYRPMNVRDSEELLIKEENGRRMSTTTFLHYSAQSVFRQKIKWKLAKMVEDAVNGVARRKLLDMSCKAAPTPDVMAK